MRTVSIGIVGGGLMGRETASAIARWCALTDVDARPMLVGVADPSDAARAWFEALPGVRLLTARYEELLDDDGIDVVYVAVPHQLHEEVYTRVLEAGKDLLAEKPFGIDAPAAGRIARIAERAGRFVRCSSEFPFLPGAQAAYAYARSGRLGRILEAVSGFHHSSDLDPGKAANWKRQSATCGEIGVMGDLGLHVCHLPLRLGWRPRSVYAQLQKGFPRRPDGRGGMAACDTWDTATLHTNVPADAGGFPLRLEMKRLAPGETNTWFFEAFGTEGGVRYSTREPKTLRVFERDAEQWWKRTDLGFRMPFGTVTGGIFEPGFPDIIQQMWASFLTEREGSLGDRFGCATVDEALASHAIFGAALRSQAGNRVEAIGDGTA